jgi:hypothetical protein
VGRDPDLCAEGGGAAGGPGRPGQVATVDPLPAGLPTAATRWAGPAAWPRPPPALLHGVRTSLLIAAAVALAAAVAGLLLQPRRTTTKEA